MKPVRNPELEQIRNAVLAEKVDYSEIASHLEASCYGLHASFLFHPEGRRALKALCTVMSATPPTPEYTSWKDLGGALGLTFHQMGCIENYKHDDSTELVLKTFAQKPESTIDTVIRVINNLKRYDILTSIRNPLLDLAEYTKRECIRRIDEVDNGYCSLTEGSPQQVVSNPHLILRPEGHHHLYLQLPITLQDLMAAAAAVTRLSPPPLSSSTINNQHTANHPGHNTVVSLLPTTCDDLNVQDESLQRSCNVGTPARAQSRQCSRRVMLTFAEDGAETAREVAKELRRERNGGKRIGVLILGDHEDKVQSNPHKFITHYFHKMDFIVPIVTEGYLEALHNPNGDFLASQCLDAQYIQFIHDLMTKYYVNNSCRNDRFRCIIPDDQMKTVLKHPHKRIEPVLGVFFRVSDIESLATRLLTTRKPSHMGYNHQ